MKTNQFTTRPRNKYFSPLLKNIEVLKSIKKLSDGWNGEGTSKFSEGLIDRVLSLVSPMSMQPDIFPTGRHSIQLEFEEGDDYLEFEIFEDKIIALLQFDGRDEEIQVTEEKIFELIDNFYAGQENI